jgi:hypothetical protein
MRRGLGESPKPREGSQTAESLEERRPEARGTRLLPPCFNFVFKFNFGNLSEARGEAQGFGVRGMKTARYRKH